GLADAVVVTVLSSLCITAISIMKIIGDLLCSVQWPTSAPAQVKAATAASEYWSWDFQDGTVLPVQQRPGQPSLRTRRKAGQPLVTVAGRLQHLREAPSGGHPLPHHIPACLRSDYITYGNECHLCIESL
ncbi:hypothetical protein J1605_014581, partial [Eschrichtius robustus]